MAFLTLEITRQVVVESLEKVLGNGGVLSQADKLKRSIQMEWDFRALELHGRSMWDHEKLGRALAFARRHRLNALVLHESDLTNQIVFPRSLFDPYSFWGDAPVRRGFNAIHNDRVFMRYLLRQAEQHGIQVWLELKELTFPDEVLERYPHLLKDGIVCPSEPVWFDFIERKFAELAEDFPQISGVITSPGSPEGRASLVQRKCRCPLCESADLKAWYSSIIQAIHGPLNRAGMGLAVREFSYKRADQDALVAAIDESPPDVIFCVKVTPHDFYPTFPHNPAIGMTGRTQWVEYDTMGQFYGWGVFPCYVGEDLRNRFGYCSGRGASGALLRVEWERVNDCWALENLNIANLLTGAALLGGDDPDLKGIAGATLEELGLQASGSERDVLAEILTRTWDVMSKGIYMEDMVFHDCSQFPLTSAKAWWTMEERHGLGEWAPEKKAALATLDREQVDFLLEVKDEALTLIADLDDRVAAIGNTQLGRFLGDRFSLYRTYIEGFRLIAEVCLLAPPGDRGPFVESPAARARLAKAMERLADYGRRIEALPWERYRHQVLMLMDPERVKSLLMSVKQG